MALELQLAQNNSDIIESDSGCRLFDTKPLKYPVIIYLQYYFPGHIRMHFFWKYHRYVTRYTQLLGGAIYIYTELPNICAHR